MDASARRSRGGGNGGNRAGRAGAVTAVARRLTIALALAAFAAAILPFPAAAQNPPAPAAPSAHPAQPTPPAGAPSPPARAPAANNGRPPDLAFGAFQRGYYITAFALATKNVDDKADPKAMTLLGELYANGLGVPQDDKKAAEWYK